MKKRNATKNIATSEGNKKIEKKVTKKELNVRLDELANELSEAKRSQDLILAAFKRLGDNNTAQILEDKQAVTDGHNILNKRIGDAEKQILELNIVKDRVFSLNSRLIDIACASFFATSLVLIIIYVLELRV